MNTSIRIIMFWLCFLAFFGNVYAQISSTPTITLGGILDYKMAAVSFQDQAANGATACNTATALTKTLVISGIPAGATVEAAYLYWATLSNDATVTFKGTSVSAGISWLDHLMIPGGILGGAVDQFAYFCKADVTSLMIAGGNGSYNITNLTTVATVASGGGCLAGAVLMVVYNTTIADPNYLNAIYLFEGTKGIIGPAHSPTSGQTTFATITLNTLVTQTVAAKFSDVVWMGGSVLANAAYDDSLSINSIPLTDANNPGNDQFNGTGTNNAPLSCYNVDADTYSITPMITAGSTSVKMRARSKQNDYYVINAFVIGLRRFADWGDAPDSYGTTAAVDGPLHYINTFPGQLVIGTKVNNNSLLVASNESNGQPGVVATADDDDGLIVFPPILETATTYSVTVPVLKTLAGNAYLVGYMDFNRDGDFLDAGERSNTATIAASGSFTLNFSGFTAVAGNTYARFRVSTSQTAIQSHLGWAPDGEVEDYGTPITALPLTLLSFEAQKKDNEIKLSWSTASENNVKEFVLERAGTDGIFKTIGNVTARGNSIYKNDYTFNDVKSESAITLLYRLKQVDFNGSFIYSKTVTLKNPTSSLQLIHANLSSNRLNLNVNIETAGNIIIKIFNAGGSEVFQTQMTVSEGGHQLHLDVPEFPSGIYFLYVENPGAEAIRMKLIK